VVQPVAAKQGIVRDIDVERVAHEADVVADDLRAPRVVELDAVAALRGGIVALAGDQVALDAHIVGLFDPQPEEVVGEVAVLHHGAVRTGKDVDAGVLVAQAVAGVADDQPVDGDVGGRDADGVAPEPARQGRPLPPAQGQRFGDQEVLEVAGALDFDRVPRRRAVDRRLDRFAGLHAPGGGGDRCRAAEGGQRGEGEEGGEGEPGAPGEGCRLPSRPLRGRSRAGLAARHGGGDFRRPAGRSI
jgi:hypothetical protein